MNFANAIVSQGNGYQVGADGVKRHCFDVQVGDSLYYVACSGQIYQRVANRWNDRQSTLRTVTNPSTLNKLRYAIAIA